MKTRKGWVGKVFNSDDIILHRISGESRKWNVFFRTTPLPKPKSRS